MKRFSPIICSLLIALSFTNSVVDAKETASSSIRQTIIDTLTPANGDNRFPSASYQNEYTCTLKGPGSDTMICHKASSKPSDNSPSTDKTEDDEEQNGENYPDNNMNSYDEPEEEYSTHDDEPSEQKDSKKPDEPMSHKNLNAKEEIPSDDDASTDMPLDKSNKPGEKSSDDASHNNLNAKEEIPSDDDDASHNNLNAKEELPSDDDDASTDMPLDKSNKPGEKSSDDASHNNLNAKEEIPSDDDASHKNLNAKEEIPSDDGSCPMTNADSKRLASVLSTLHQLAEKAEEKASQSAVELNNGPQNQGYVPVESLSKVTQKLEDQKKVIKSISDHQEGVCSKTHEDIIRKRVEREAAIREYDNAIESFKTTHRIANSIKSTYEQQMNDYAEKMEKELDDLRKELAKYKQDKQNGDSIKTGELHDMVEEIVKGTVKDSIKGIFDTAYLDFRRKIGSFTSDKNSCCCCCSKTSTNETTPDEGKKRPSDETYSRVIKKRKCTHIKHDPIKVLPRPPKISPNTSCKKHPAKKRDPEHDPTIPPNIPMHKIIDFARAFGCPRKSCPKLKCECKNDHGNGGDDDDETPPETPEDPQRDYPCMVSPIQPSDDGTPGNNEITPPTGSMVCGMNPLTDAERATLLSAGEDVN